MRTPKVVLRGWFLASVLVSWQRFVGPLTRKAYHETDTKAQIKELKELRKWLAGWVAAIDELVAPGPMRRAKG